MRKLITLIAMVLISFSTVRAQEGMWIPSLLEQLNEEEMQGMGMELSAQDVYNINNSSLKDAIVHFNGGCTSELISPNGLLLTNHHCGYSSIQSHSSVENDYLKDGFWAKSRKEELANPNLSATLIKSIDEVTDKVLAGVTEEMTEEERNNVIKDNVRVIKEAAIEGTHYEAIVKPYYHGNQYYLIITEVFKDVRLVGAPPSSIGKFGSDTDNWVWPRHTGDFSIFRIYAGKDNKPAEYSEENVPYTPKHYLPVSTSGIKEGDFTMVYGFPGRTDEYLPSYAVDYIMNVQNPAKIKLRETALNIMDKKMRVDDATRIKYASTYASIANGWKKWIGENIGLKQTNAIKRKKELEKTFLAKLTDDQKEYGEALLKFEDLYKQRAYYAQARDYLIEVAFVSPDVISYAANFNGLFRVTSEEDQNVVIEKLKSGIKGHYKNYDAEIDQKVVGELLSHYYNDLKPGQYTPYLQEVYETFDGDFNRYAEVMFEDSYLVSQERTEELLSMKPKKILKKLKKDPAYMLYKAMLDHYRGEIAPKYSELEDKIALNQRVYMKGLMEVFPEKRFYPDANSTLRIAYGQVKGYEPLDAVRYGYQTYLDGVMAKYVPSDYEFDLPKKLIELYESKDYGPYADENGKMPVCFIGSNHTTGGNSGSPAINGKGQLIGLNFDRGWEGTMSDINYDISRCRNIMVDIRYVLFIVDKFAGAGYLIDEMTLVTNDTKAVEETATDEKPVMAE